MLAGRRMALLIGCLFALIAAARVMPAAAATPLKILPDDVCGGLPSDGIRVCGAPLQRDAMVRLRDMVECVVYWQRTSSHAALTTYIRTGDPDGFRVVFASDHSCQGYSGMRVSAILLGGAFAEALLRDPPRDNAVSLAVSEAPPTPSEPSGGDIMSCALATGHKEALAFIRATPFSRREQIAVTTFTGRLRPCLPADQEIRMNLAVFRAVVAIRLYVEALQAPKYSSAGRAEPSEPRTPPPPPPSLTASDILGIDRLSVPSLSISPAEVPPLADTAAGIQRDRADLPNKPDDEERLSNEAEPGVDPNTGESTKMKSQLPARRDPGSPY
jgi:hypothetical protein